MADININQHAVLVRLTISTKGLLGERRDDTASDTLVHAFMAKDDRSIAGKVMLLNQRAKTIRAVRATAHAVRMCLYTYTMPWGARDTHLLPLGVRQKFEQEINKLLAAHADAKENFLDDYHNLVNARERDGEIGGLYRAENYPSLNKIKEMFECELYYSPIPTSDHFIADVTNEMKAALEEATASRVRSACNTLVDRIETRLVAYVDKLEGYSGGGDGRFNDTLVSNLQNVGELIRELNFTNDIGIDQLVSHVSRLSRFSAQQLREDEDVRQGAISTGRSLLSRLETYKKLDQETSDAFDQMSEIEL